MKALSRTMKRFAVGVGTIGLVILPTTALAGVDAKVNQDVGPLLQNETSITINRGMANNIVVGYNEVPGSGMGLGISYSNNNGVTWFDSQTPSVWGTDADPALASDLLGNVFAAMISYASTGPAVFPNNGIYVSRSTNGGATWLLPTMVDQYTGAPGPYFTDKEYITVDQYTGSPYTNNVYIAWQRDNANGTNADVFFAWSGDQATTWNYATGTPAGRISDLASTPGSPPVQSSLANGPVPAVAPDGTIYVAWQDAPLGIQSPGRIYVDKSTDGGVTFGTDVIAANYNTCARWPKGGLSFQVRSFPSIAVNPTLNPMGNYDVYVVYAEDPDRGPDISIESDLPPGNTASSQAEVSCQGNYVYSVWADMRSGSVYPDIYFNRSTDNGATWGTDQRINTGVGAGVAFVQTPRIASVGTNVYVVWEDRRNGSPDIYYNFSGNNGATWLASAVRLDVGTTPGTTNAWAPEIGASGGNVYVTWSDDRSGDSDVLFNYSADGGVTWQPSAIRIDNAAGGVWSNMPQLTCQGQNVCVTWWDARNGNDDIFCNASTNGGATWQVSDARLDTGTGISGSPTICSQGTFVYVAWWDQKNGLQDVYFNYSANNGLTWQPADTRLDVGSPAGSSTADVIDLACAGSNVYAVWADTRNGLADIYMNYSTNNGATWQLQDIRLDADFVPGSHQSYFPRVNAEPGFVYVVWEEDRHGMPDVYFRYSLTSGLTWYGRDFRLDTDYPAAAVSIQPRMASTGNNVYVVWQDSRNGASDIYFNSSANNGVSWRDGPDDGDIMLVRSDNNGATWNAPVTVNNDPGPSGQFQPWIDVKPNGVIDVVWYDRRNDGNDSWLDVYMGTSFNRGVTFTNSRVSDVNFGPPPPPTVWPWPWMGEYIGIDVSSTHAYVVWTDTRLSDRDIYFDRFENPTATGVLPEPDIPGKSYLAQSFPNPFNPRTTITFGVTRPGSVSLKIYDVSGRLVRALVNQELPAGHYEEAWDGRDDHGAQVASGVYFYRLSAGGFSQTRKIVLLK